MFKVLSKCFTRGNHNKNNSLFTLGYEGLKPDDFVSRLKENNIEILVDVREVAWSRKRGFSKSQLQAFLNLNGIKYVHMKSLGSPSEIRKKVKENADYDYFFKEYTNYIESKMDVIQSLLGIVEKTVCCLMCFERDAEFCHRKVIALELKRIDGNGLKIEHL